MNIIQNIRITGIGKFLPDAKISSDELEARFGIQKGFSIRHSGVRERYHVSTESNAYLGAMALQEALQRAGLQATDLDLLICGSATFDYILPHQGAATLQELSAADELHIPTINVVSSCLSFVSAFEVAAAMLQVGQYRKIAIVSAEISSKGLNPSNQEQVTLFGDGAAAVIVEKDPTGASGIIKAYTQTYTEGFDYSIIRGGGNKFALKDYPYDPALHSFEMKGKNLLKLACRKIPEFFSVFFQDLSMNLADVDLIIPHQASKMGLFMFRKMYPLRDDQVFSNLETHGNCIAASIPMGLYDAITSGQLQREQLCLITGTAAGFSIGGVLFIY